MRKNGFTLIELLVVIAILGSLSVIIGVNSIRLTKTSYQKEYYQTFRDFFDSASVYSELSTVNCEDGCTFTIDALIEKGLVEVSIYEKNNPLYKDQKVFSNTDSFNVYFVEGKKQIKFISGQCTLERSELKEDYEWEKC